MLVLLSPSKKLDEESKVPTQNYSQPQFLADAEILSSGLKKLTRGDISDLMGLSQNLSDLNYTRYQNFKVPFTQQNARPALFTFKGDVYDKMDVENYSDTDLEFAQNHIRILSGLYGILKPLDLMQPYRLEMGTKYKNKRGHNLYGFWDSKLTENINAEESELVLNLASNEYFKAIKPKALKANLLDITFKQYKDGQLKNIGLMAKRARGLMADFVIKNKITDKDKIMDFNAGGYSFAPDLSTDKNWTFTMKM
jgi:cytoplasmic iron level regulating protein YaaA (DUF328/UPF0246 family)